MTWYQWNMTCVDEIWYVSMKYEMMSIKYNIMSMKYDMMSNQWKLVIVARTVKLNELLAYIIMTLIWNITFWELYHLV